MFVVGFEEFAFYPVPFYLTNIPQDSCLAIYVMSH